MLIVGLSTLGLDVLLNGVNLTLVVDKLLLNIVQLDVDIRLEDLVLFGIVLHLLIGHLFVEAISIDIQEALD